MTSFKPRVDHIRVFVSLIWTHIPKEKRKKLDDESLQGVLVCCFENSLYKVWVRDTRQPILSRHVEIVEDKFPQPGLHGFDGTEPLEELPDYNPRGANSSNTVEAPVDTNAQKGGVDLDNLDADLLTHIPEVQSTHGVEESSGGAEDDV